MLLSHAACEHYLPDIPTAQLMLL